MRVTRVIAPVVCVLLVSLPCMSWVNVVVPAGPPCAKAPGDRSVMLVRWPMPFVPQRAADARGVVAAALGCIRKGSGKWQGCLGDPPHGLVAAAEAGRGGGGENRIFALDISGKSRFR